MDTICAISTAQGVGAIAVVRASGPSAFEAAGHLFRPEAGISTLPAQQAKFAHLYDGEQLVDQVVVLKYAAPRSYTGEDMVEISCHGSLYIQKKILELLIEHGCRMAMPGEFTQRAFMNGKLDLPQAEAVGDLINSQSETSHHLAINQLRGGISKKMHQLRESLVHVASLLELELDFSEEDVTFANREDLDRLLAEIATEADTLAQSFKIGNLLKTGIPVAIVGRPNVGKSTLLNALLQHDRAIVSQVPGTTRDTIEDTLTIGGTLFRFIDTAGLRNTNDEVEQYGIERSYEAARRAAVILYLCDNSQQSRSEILDDFHNLQAQVDTLDKHIIFIFNKIDLVNEAQGGMMDKIEERYPAIAISAKARQFVNDVEDALLDFVESHRVQDMALLTNERHYGLLKSISKSIADARQGLAEGIPTDLLVEDIRAALTDIGTLTGTISTDDILNNIFGHFCIGK
ncbi:MAG: tRNA uridine-5-carboxymethylaminomethyl(34) synthesis GTPase MnmE [Bacteroidales bacterium]|nr:tRNA uridine-5-carboxymethylaminomethyl(34) synthesis GTPase MnmE [Bacteroidales bacterium]